MTRSRVPVGLGLVGLPNAGKSTLIRAMSAAKPKVADYPFTTLHPNLGVVSVGPLQSFVMADVPGLIEGAAEGAGLGIQFLKHLQRTCLLLHLVDIAPMGDESKPVESVRAIEEELGKFSEDLKEKPRWLVINKTDLLVADKLDAEQMIWIDLAQTPSLERSVLVEIRLAGLRVEIVRFVLLGHEEMVRDEDAFEPRLLGDLGEGEKILRVFERKGLPELHGMTSICGAA